MRVLGAIGEGWRGKAFFGFCVVLGLCLFVPSLFPFEPLKVSGVRVMPPKLCESDVVMVSVERTWQTRPWEKGTTIDVESQWVDPDMKATYPAAERYNVPVEEIIGNGTVVSPVVRTAPPRPGRFKLETDYTVHGFRALIPGTQYASSESGNHLTVKGCGND